MAHSLFSRRRSSKVSNQFQRRALRAAVEALEPRQLLSYGSLDPTFGTAGVKLFDATGPIGTPAQVMVEQSDGKFVVGTTINGEFGLERFNADGSLDTGFGSGGEVRTSFGPGLSNGGLADIALAPDGRIVAVGEENGLVAVAKYNPDGSLDTSFNGSGELTFDFTNGDGDTANMTLVTVDGDDRIVIAGADYSSTSVTNSFAVARITAAGSLDTSFNGTGEEVISLGDGNNARLTAIATNPANQIVLVGSLNKYSVGIAWLDGDGSLNTAFNGDGLADVAPPGGYYYSPSAVAIDSQDRLVIAGTDFQGSGNEYIAVSRVNADGSPDLTFNGDGKENLFTTSSTAIAASIAIESNGVIVVGGEATYSSGYSDFAVAELNGDGSMDTSFNGSGTETISLGTDINATDASIAVDSSGNVLLGGTAESSTFTPSFFNQQFAFAEVTATGAADDSLNETGTEYTLYSGSQNVDSEVTTLESDGDMIVAFSTDEGMDSYLVRLNPDGTTDTSFGVNGMVHIATPNFLIASVATAADGTIYIGGDQISTDPITQAQSETGFVVYSITSGGLTNSAFNGGAPKTITFFSGELTSLGGMVVDGNGNLILAGGTDNDSGTAEIAVVRLTSGGNFDGSFNSSGELLWDLDGASFSFAAGVALDGQGDIILAGETKGLPSSQTDDVFVAMLTPNGTPDTNFGPALNPNGFSLLDTLPAGVSGFAQSVAIDSSGNIIASGFTQSATGVAFLVAKFDGTGQLDGGFNGGVGYFADNFGGSAQSYAVAVDGAGDIFPVGIDNTSDGTEYVAIADLTPDGTLNTAFGSGGTVLALADSTISSAGNSAEIDGSGRLLVGGISYVDAVGIEGFVARYTNVPLTTAVSVPAVSVTYGTSATLSATVTSDESVNTGSVRFTVTDSLSNVVDTVTVPVADGFAQTSVALPAGAYNVSAAYSDASGEFASAGGAGTLAVTPAPLTIAVNNVTVPYGTPMISFGVIYSGLVNGDDQSSLSGSLSFSTAATSASPVGNYAVTVSGISSTNYAITFLPGTLTIAQAALIATVQSTTSVYGSALPAFSVSYAGFENNENSSVLGGSLVFSTSASSSSPVGDYAVSASGQTAANYAITYQSGDLNITPAALTVSVNNVTSVYGSSIPALTVSYSGLVNGDTASSLGGTLSLVTTAASTSGAGNYDASAVGLSSSNYAITYQDGTVTITQAALTIAAANATSVYGGSIPTLTGTISGVQNGDSITAAYSTAASSASGVGGYAITPAAVASPSVLANYSVNLMPGTLTITAAPLAVAVDNAMRAVGAANPTFTSTTTGLVNGDSVTITYSTTAAASSPAGNYPINATVTGSDLSNYNLTVTPGTLVVTPVVGSQNLIVTVKNASRDYGAANPTFTGKVTGAINGDTFTVTYSTTATASSPVGSYAITATVTGSDLSNYNLIVTPGTLTVKAVSLHVSASNANRVYGAANPTFSGNVNGLVNGDTISVTYSTIAAASSPVASYAITPLVTGSALSNYNLTVSTGTLKITPAALSVVAAPQSKVYGQANPTLTGTITGLQNGDNITATYATTATASSGVGTYAITPTLVDPNGELSNYNLKVVSSKLTVTKAPLSISADNQTMVYGSAIPALTISYNGFVNGDTPASLMDAPNVTTPATASSNVGSYNIRISGAASNNYSITYASGVLTITQATLYVEVNSTSKLIGQPDPKFTATDTGFVLSQTASVLGGKLVFTTTAGTNSPVGIYEVDASGLTSKNYDIVYIAGTLTEL